MRAFHPRRVLKELVITLQVAFSQQRKVAILEDSDPLVDVVDIHRDRLTSAFVVEQRVGVLNVDFAFQQGRTNLQERLIDLGKFDSDDIGFERFEGSLTDDFHGTLVLVDDQAGDRVIDRVGDADADDPQVILFQFPQQFVKLTDSIFEEDAELTQARPIPSPHRCWGDLFAVVKIVGFVAEIIVHRLSILSSTIVRQPSTGRQGGIIV